MCLVCVEYVINRKKTWSNRKSLRVDHLNFYYYGAFKNSQ